MTTSQDEYEYVDDSSGLEAPSETDLRIADSLSASRRRRYESTTAAAVSARKYRFRKRMLTVMAVLILASGRGGVHLVVGHVVGVRRGRRRSRCCTWRYLRRQTRIEERVRRRRAQRIARSRLGRGEHR